MSLKDLGKKYTYINKVNEEIFIRELLKQIDDNIDWDIHNPHITS